MTDLLDDRTFSAHSTIAGLFWIVGGVLLIAFLITERPGLGAVGLFLGLIGGTVNVRGFLSEYAHRVENARKLAQDYQRSQNRGGGNLHQL